MALLPDSPSFMQNSFEEMTLISLLLTTANKISGLSQNNDFISVSVSKYPVIKTPSAPTNLVVYKTIL